MAKFTYTSKDRSIEVRVDGKRRGSIFPSKGGGWHYSPKRGVWGETFPTWNAVKRDIEGDDMPVSLVERQASAYPFDSDVDVSVAIMEARHPQGICAGEPSSCFGTYRYEGETAVYVKYTPSDDAGEQMFLTRGVK